MSSNVFKPSVPTTVNINKHAYEAIVDFFDRFKLEYTDELRDALKEIKDNDCISLLQQTKLREALVVTLAMPSNQNNPIIADPRMHEVRENNYNEGQKVLLKREIENNLYDNES